MIVNDKQQRQLILEAMSDDKKIEPLAGQFRMLSYEYVQIMVWRHTERCGATMTCAQLLLKLLEIENDRRIDSYADSFRDD